MNYSIPDTYPIPKEIFLQLSDRAIRTLLGIIAFSYRKNQFQSNVSAAQIAKYIGKHRKYILRGLEELEAKSVISRKKVFGLPDIIQINYIIDKKKIAELYKKQTTPGQI